MTKYLIAALAVLTALAGLWGALEHERTVASQLREKAALEAAGRLQASLAMERRNSAAVAAISASRQATINQLRQDAERTQKALNDALKANPEWAGARVPDGVWDALGIPADEAPARPGLDNRSGGAQAPRPRQRGAR